MRRAPRRALGRQRAGSRRPRGQSAGAPAFAGGALGQAAAGRVPARAPHDGGVQHHGVCAVAPRVDGRKRRAEL